MLICSFKLICDKDMNYFYQGLTDSPRVGILYWKIIKANNLLWSSVHTQMQLQGISEYSILSRDLQWAFSIHLRYPFWQPWIILCLSLKSLRSFSLSFSQVPFCGLVYKDKESFWPKLRGPAYILVTYKKIKFLLGNFPSFHFTFLTLPNGIICLL